jgi:membrane-bound metal-dependent hydrolase YbcI (DUF457 family)
MTAALRQALPRIPMVRSAVLIGSLAPDVAFYLLTPSACIYFYYVMDWPLNQSARYIFDILYFEDPVWIAAHNLLHSPVSLAVGLGVARLLRTRWSHFSHWMHWFLMACLLHSFVDILTHHDDGPVLFWPLNWHYRFPSPISYWDNAHFGRQVGIFEWILDLSLVGYLIFHWRRSKV